MVGKTTNERFARRISSSMTSSEDDEDSLIMSHDKESILGSSRNNSIVQDLDNE
jgi:hypothetical protein